MQKDFEKHLIARANEISAYLEQVLDFRTRKGEIARPKRLMDAMRHAALDGGKRLRPFLVIETAAMFDVSAKTAMPTAAALECVHCYSLVHDDLPAMDDDDLRRGQPTVHKAYDEATAILAGDSLLTLAFDLVSAPHAGVSAEIRNELTIELARAAGPGGMAGGQMLDLQAETGNPGEDEIRLLQSMKTGALIRFACEAGAILGKASKKDRQLMRQFGEKIGAAFQLADDILDVTASTEAMGKKTGKDGEAGKGTIVALLGMEAAQTKLADLVKDANSLLQPFGESAAILALCTRYVAEREN